MLQMVDVGEQSLASYRGTVPELILDELSRVAEDLRGARVLHLSATPYGGGVSELLRSVVPLQNDLGLISHWQVIAGEKEFFDVTKALHNALQGAKRDLDPEEQRTFLRNAERNAAELGGQRYDFVFVHDPQPAALLPLGGKHAGRWIWRCHIDTSAPSAGAWAFLRGFLSDYDAAIFTIDDFLPPDLPIDRVELIPPAIDPDSPKNIHLDDHVAREVLEWIGLRSDRPLMTQVSRFDPWKDPLGVIAAYRLVREECPGLQLALAGSMALDDPEGFEIYHAIEQEARDDPLIHVFTNLTGVGNVEVNAFQRLSDVVVQKSIREGFGLVVSEALWKRTPVVAGRAGGIPLQMADGVGGFLVDGVEACAEAVLRLLRDPDEAAELAERGHRRTREHFLVPRLLLNELSLMLDLAAERPLTPAPIRAAARRDPVCGMAIADSTPALELTHDGHDYAFCSQACRARFEAYPERYLPSTLQR